MTFSPTMGGNGDALNIILDPLLMFGMGMGFAGSAVATACSNLASTVFFLVIFYRMREKNTLSLAFRDFSMEFLPQVFFVGIASALTATLANASNMVIVKLASGYGERDTGHDSDFMQTGAFEYPLSSGDGLAGAGKSVGWPAQ